jgi:hypothetical protein
MVVAQENIGKGMNGYAMLNWELEKAYRTFGKPFFMGSKLN